MKAFKDIKKLTATYTNDDAIDLEILEKSLRFDKNYKLKTERDAAFIALAMDALRFVIEDYKRLLKVKYPSHEDIALFVKKKLDKN